MNDSLSDSNCKWCYSSTIFSFVFSKRRLTDSLHKTWLKEHHMCDSLVFSISKSVPQYSFSIALQSLQRHEDDEGLQMLSFLCWRRHVSGNLSSCIQSCIQSSIQSCIQFCIQSLAVLPWIDTEWGCNAVNKSLVDINGSRVLLFIFFSQRDCLSLHPFDHQFCCRSIQSTSREASGATAFMRETCRCNS